MWNVLLCEDDLEQGHYLERLTAAYPGLRTTLCASGDRLETFFTARGRPDILLMDIRLGDQDGIQMVKRLAPETSGVQVIYVTGYVEFCTRVYETAHVSFLTKPVQQGELFAALDRAVAALERDRSAGILVQSRSAAHYLPLVHIRYLESVGRKLRVVADQGVYENYGRLRDIEARLDRRFFHCHKSFIVNLDRAVSVDLRGFCLDSGERVPISARKRAEAREAFLRRMEEDLSISPGAALF